jgi:hypothetical protein
MFSNSTEGDMFTAQWCGRCRFGVEDSFCDDAAPILWGDPPPKFLRRVALSEMNPTGVVCDRFERVVDTVTTVWHCVPPAPGVGYVVVREEWTDPPASVRHIHEVQEVREV